jgi:hypothetical protein
MNTSGEGDLQMMRTPCGSRREGKKAGAQWRKDDSQKGNQVKSGANTNFQIQIVEAILLK